MRTLHNEKLKAIARGDFGRVRRKVKVDLSSTAADETYALRRELNEGGKEGRRKNPAPTLIFAARGEGKVFPWKSQSERGRDLRGGAVAMAAAAAAANLVSPF